MYTRRSLCLATLGLFTVVFLCFVSNGRKEHLRVKALRRFSDFNEGGQTWPGWAGIDNIFAFGDSFTETGFDIEGPQPNAQNPLGNPTWPGQTPSTGANWLGHLTGTFNESFVKTYNFARAGSPIESKGKQGDGLPPSLGQQIELLFLPRHGSEEGTNRFMRSSLSGWKPHNSLFVFYAGVDDLMSSFIDRGGMSSANEVAMHMKQYLFNLKKIYDNGARNIMIVNMPALEESPEMRLTSILNSMFAMGAHIVDFNGRLAFMAHQFAESHPDANVFFFDNLRLTVSVRDNPQHFPETKAIKYREGYCVNTKADLRRHDAKATVQADCEKELDQWYWRDKMHATESSQRLQARMMVEHMQAGVMLPYEFY